MSLSLTDKPYSLLKTRLKLVFLQVPGTIFSAVISVDLAIWKLFIFLYRAFVTTADDQ